MTTNFILNFINFIDNIITSLFGNILTSLSTAWSNLYDIVVTYRGVVLEYLSITSYFIDLSKLTPAIIICAALITCRIVFAIINLIYP